MYFQLVETYLDLCGSKQKKKLTYILKVLKRVYNNNYYASTNNANSDTFWNVLTVDQWLKENFFNTDIKIGYISNSMILETTSFKGSHNEKNISQFYEKNLKMFLKNLKQINHKGFLLPEYTEGLSMLCSCLMQIGVCARVGKQNFPYSDNVLVVLGNRHRTLYWSSCKQADETLQHSKTNIIKSHIPLSLLNLKKTNSQYFISENNMEGFTNVDLITEIYISRQKTPNGSQPGSACNTTISIHMSNSVADIKIIHFQMPEKSAHIFYMCLSQVCIKQVEFI